MLAEFIVFSALFQSTLPRRERLQSFYNVMFLSGFNPRSREGSDRLIALDRTPEHKFQSTLPRRERLQSFYNVMFLSGFNPRSREGSDVSPPAHVDDYHCFNPRSREGSDWWTCLTMRINLVRFNPRSREGSDIPCAGRWCGI